MYQSNIILDAKQNGQVPTLVAHCQERLICSLVSYGSDDLSTEICEEIDDALTNMRLDSTLLDPILDHFQNRPTAKNGFTLLHISAAENLTSLCALLLSRNVPLEVYDSAIKGTPLHMAAHGGSIECAIHLLAKGLHVDIRNLQDNSTPLHWASFCNDDNTIMLQTLLDHGADIHAISATSAMKLEAEEDDDWDCDKYEGFGGTPLHWASEGGNMRNIMFLLDRGACLEATDLCGKLPFHWAAEHGKTDVVAFFAERGVDIEIKDRQGRSPLNLAVANGHASTVRFLSEKGASIANGPYGPTLLAMAAGKGDLPTVELLLEKGAEIDGAGGFCGGGMTALGMAARGNYTGVMILLLDKGAAIDKHLVSWVQGTCPALYIAVLNGNVEAATLLLDRGANVETPSDRGETSLHTAASLGKLEIGSLLLDRGALVTAVSALDAQTVLHKAVMGGGPDSRPLEFTRMILQRGGHVSINVPDDEGNTPVHLIFLSFMQWIRSRGCSLQNIMASPADQPAERLIEMIHLFKECILIPPLLPTPSQSRYTYLASDVVPLRLAPCHLVPLTHTFDLS